LTLLGLAAAAPALRAQTTPGSARAATPAAFTGGADLPVDRIVAVVGTKPIMWSEVAEAVLERRAQGLEFPTDSAAQMTLARQVLSELVDEEVLVQKAQEAKIEVAEDELANTVDGQVKQIRARFTTDAEFREELRKAGRGSPDDLRRALLEQARRAELARRYIAKMREENKLVSGVVSEEEVRREFEARRATAGKRPASVGFRQIVIAPTPSKPARDRALAKAESLLVELRKGGDFALIAKRESMDPGSRELGGDLGWNRRGTMVPEFDRVMFAINPGQLSPVIETGFGYHIIRVDRVQPQEVKARHILIRPVIDSADVAAARVRADSVYNLWKGGATFESLVAKYHDRRGLEQTVVPEVPRDQIPASYAAAIANHKVGDHLPPFAIEDRANSTSKFVVAELTLLNEGGDYQLADVRTQIRERMAQEKGMKRLLAGLRESMYVSMRL
jgi:peptidyl-prolyl cis-trans isomerase SurA